MKIRMRLSFKFFMVFLLAFVVLIVLMVMAIQLYAQWSFFHYIQTVEALRLDEVATTLSEEYAVNQGWEQLRNNGQRWTYILRPLGPPPDPGRYPRLPSGLFPLRSKASRDYDELAKEQPYGQGPRPHGEDGPVPIGIESRFTLFDMGGKPVAGRGTSTRNHTLKRVAVAGNTVGWLGLLKEERLSKPMDLAFVREQSYAFYTIGALMLVVASGIAFFLSRHLLSPIHQLAGGTRALASLRFGTRIEVQTGDELGQLASDFNLMSKTLERYEEMRKQWISDISHELRTPLSILQGEIEAIQDGVREPDGRVLESLHAEVLHLGRIVADLHDLSLADIGALRVIREPVKALRILSETVHLFRNRFSEAHIDLLNNTDGHGTILLQADPARLTQLFTNLLENALRYMDRPGVLNIEYSVSGDFLDIYFEDSGPGIPEEALELLFDRLYRVDSSRTRAAGGSGLGLAICRAIVEAHGGKITASNGSAGGLAIHITLPLMPKQETMKAMR